METNTKNLQTAAGKSMFKDAENLESQFKVVAKILSDIKFGTKDKKVVNELINLLNNSTFHQTENNIHVITTTEEAQKLSSLLSLPDEKGKKVTLIEPEKVQDPVELLSAIEKYVKTSEGTMKLQASAAKKVGETNKMLESEISENAKLVEQLTNEVNALRAEVESANTLAEERNERVTSYINSNTKHKIATGVLGAALGLSLIFNGGAVYKHLTDEPSAVVETDPEIEEIKAELTNAGFEVAEDADLSTIIKVILAKANADSNELVGVELLLQELGVTVPEGSDLSTLIKNYVAGKDEAISAKDKEMAEIKAELTNAGFVVADGADLSTAVNQILSTLKSNPGEAELAEVVGVLADCGVTVPEGADVSTLIDEFIKSQNEKINDLETELGEIYDVLESNGIIVPENADASDLIREALENNYKIPQGYYSNDQIKAMFEEALEPLYELGFVASDIVDENGNISTELMNSGIATIVETAVANAEKITGISNLLDDLLANFVKEDGETPYQLSDFSTIESAITFLDSEYVKEIYSLEQELDENETKAEDRVNEILASIEKAEGGAYTLEDFNNIDEAIDFIDAYYEGTVVSLTTQLETAKAEAEANKELAEQYKAMLDKAENEDQTSPSTPNQSTENNTPVGDTTVNENTSPNQGDKDKVTESDEMEPGV